MPWVNFYFLTKIALHLRGDIHLDGLRSLLLLAFLAAPIPQRWPRPDRIRTARACLGAVLALLLLWSESWLPPLRTTIWFLLDPAVRPSLGYVLGFLKGALSLPLIAGVVCIGACVAAASRWRLRLPPLLAAFLAFVGVRDLFLSARGGVEAELRSFYQSEARRAVRLDQAVPAGPDFDVVFIHVCSISWEDLRAVGLQGPPFFSGFDYLFTRFNTASSYSNPAAIRLLRAPCGQTSNAALFAEAPDGCYLMEDLRRLGYRSYAASNHDGRYDHFAEAMSRHARLDEPMDVAGLPAASLNFDDSAIFSDSALLQRWWKLRQASGARKAALYYNTVSLHQGAHAQTPAGTNPWQGDRFTRYRGAAEALSSDLGRFFAELEASGRNAAVFFVAEHGAALLGTRIQAQDLREIPLPQITLCPAAVKLIGPGRRPPARPLLIDQPVSYLALAELLRTFVERPPFGRDAGAASPSAVRLPETPFVSESESTRVMQRGAGFWYQANGQAWRELPDDVLPAGLSASSGPSRSTR